MFEPRSQSIWGLRAASRNMRSHNRFCAFRAVDFYGVAGHVFRMEDIVDTRGLKCPLPVLKLGKVLRGVPVGTIVTLWADDPVAVIDIPHFCIEAGHELVSQTTGAAFQTYCVKRG